MIYAANAEHASIYFETIRRRNYNSVALFVAEFQPQKTGKCIVRSYTFRYLVERVQTTSVYLHCIWL